MVRGIVAAVLALIAVVIALEPWAPYRRPGDTGQGGSVPVPTVAAPAQPAGPPAGVDASSGRVIARPWVEEPVTSRSERRQVKRTRDVVGGRDSGKRSAGHKTAAVRVPAKAAHERPGAVEAVTVPPLKLAQGDEPARRTMADARPLPLPVPALPPEPAIPPGVKTPVQPPPVVSSASVPTGQPLPAATPAPMPSELPPAEPLPPKAEEMVAVSEPGAVQEATTPALPATTQIVDAAATAAAMPAVPRGLAASPAAPPAQQPWLRPWVSVPPQPPKWAPITPRPPTVAYSPVAPLPPYFPVPWQVPAWGPVAARPAGMAPVWPTVPASVLGYPGLGAAQPRSPFTPPAAWQPVLRYPVSPPPGPVLPAPAIPAAPAPEVLVARPVGYTGLAVTVPGPAGQPQTLMFPPFAMLMALCSVPGELVKAVQRLPLQ